MNIVTKYRTFKWLLISILMLFSLNANAQNFDDWWVDIKNDRVENIKTMLNQGMDPNEVSTKGQPSIMYAVEQQSWLVFDLLANSRKTALNAINVNRETPLMYLAVVGQTERAKHLIKKGALVNRPDGNWTALHYAASTGKTDTAKMLLDNDAYINALSGDGTTPIMMAAYSGNMQTVQLLLDAGANVHLKSSQGYSVVDWAMLKSNKRIAQQLQDLIDTQMGVKPIAKEKTTGSSSEATTSSGTSKYFDLDRFDDPVSP